MEELGVVDPLERVEVDGQVQHVLGRHAQAPRVVERRHRRLPTYVYRGREGGLAEAGSRLECHVDVLAFGLAADSALDQHVEGRAVRALAQNLRPLFEEDDLAPPEKLSQLRV